MNWGIKVLQTSALPLGYVAGLARVAGFEPAHDGIRIRCLTAWRYPNILCLSFSLLTVLLSVAAVLKYHRTFRSSLLRRLAISEKSYAYRLSLKWGG